MRAVALRPGIMFLGLLFLLLSAGQVVAQYGNEWITYGQPYFKIPVAKVGIYRLTADDLLAAGVPLGTDPALLRLYHRGTEQAISVVAGSDGSWDAGDFIEFYGRRNDGTQDALLYHPQSLQPHPYYNLYSDTTAYFLTIAGSPGKRMATFSQAPGALTPEASHTDEKLVINTTQYSTGREEEELLLTAFDMGEGWTGDQIVQTQTIDYTIKDMLRTTPAGGTPTVELLLVGRGPMTHQGDVLLGSSQRLAGSFTFDSFNAYKFQVSAQWTDLAADGSLLVRVRCNGVAAGADRISVSYLKVRYPQSLDMANATEKVFELRGTGSLSYVNITNSLSSTRLFNITDPSNVVAIGTTTTGTLNAVIGTSGPTKVLASTQVITPQVHPVNLREIVPAQYDYLIVSNPMLRKAALGYADPVEAYAAYRESPEGGGFKPLIVNVQELCDAFNYGEYSPTAIYQFMHYMTDQGSPRYLLLAGKGLEVFYDWSRKQDNSAFAVYKDFVPSAGYPSSDMAYTAGLSGTTFEPAVPTGRIPAIKSEDIAAYLNKVKEMEARPFDQLWRKNLMHLSGGIYDGEPQLFKSYMQQFQQTAEGPLLGARVSALAKHSKDIQMINIASQVNDGLNLITFFGHASPTLLDFQLGFATDPVQGYKNKGKYPTLLMNGCQVGDFNLNTTLFGEDWVVAKDRGAIGFIGHSGYGLMSNLRRYTQLFYEVGYTDPQFVAKGLGEIQKEVARRFMENDAGWLSSISQVQQMMLLGDPAVKLFGAMKSDLEITNSDVSVVSFDGKPINMQTDSFAVRMIVRNYGLAPQATVRIEVLRTLSDNSTISYDSLYPLTRYSDTLIMVIKKKPWEISGFGDNNFRVTVDPDNIIEEYTKANNVAGKSVAIVSNGTRNLFPADFAIVNSSDVSLSVQTYDLMSDEREFIIELDTAHDFNSAYKRQWTITGKVLARQTAHLIEGDTVAYYWRSRLAKPLAGERGDWERSTFTYINNGSTGWAQVRFPQFIDNGTVGLVKDTVLRQIRFEETVQSVSVRALSSQFPNYYDSTSIRIAGVEYFSAFPGFGCRANTLNLVAFDRKSTVPYLGVKLEWFDRAGRTCGRDAMVINSYYYGDMVSDGVTDMIGYVNNIVTGDSVVLFTIGNAYYSMWPQAARTKLGEFGISEAQINSLQDDEPVVIFGRKGDAPGTAIIYRSTGLQHNVQSIAVSKTVTGGYSSGTMRSDWIGPATAWSGLHAKGVTIESSDVVSFSVYGVKTNGEEEVLVSNATDGTDLSWIDASKYPYLRLLVDATDETYITAPQLDQWLVTFTPGAEGVLYFNGTAETEKIQEGISWKGNFGFVNISDQPFSDSVTVNYEVVNQKKLTTVQFSMKIQAPLPGDTTNIALDVNTLGLSGMNDFQIFVNPHILPEHYYANNLLLLPNKFEVSEDALNPILDVTIDGRRVTNGDYVSPSPTVLVRLWDENSYILKTDTAGVRLFLTYPCSATPCAPQQIQLSDGRVKWFPATANTDFRIEFRPTDLPDGEYTLRVEGADARGNGALLAPYEIMFVVRNEPTLTISEAYPNPSTSDVYFKISVSGVSPPDFLELRVIGVNGQLQEVLTEQDFPALHIGSNELIWHGSTRNGNTLPNGLYIYKLTIGGSDKVEQRVGKLALMK